MPSEMPTLDAVPREIYAALAESHAELIEALDAEHESRKFTQNGECGGEFCTSCKALVQARKL